MLEIILFPLLQGPDGPDGPDGPGGGPGEKVGN